MNRASDQHHGLALRDELRGFFRRSAARIGELGLDVTVMVQVSQRGRRADGGRDKRTAFDGFAELLDTDFVAGSGQSLEVSNDFIPIEQFAIDADRMAEVTLGRGDLRPKAQ